MKNVLIATIAFLFFAGTESFAQYRTDHRPRTPQREAYNARNTDRVISNLFVEVKQDINQGIYRGTINNKESKKLIKTYEKIEAKERKYARKSGLDRRESDEIIRELRTLRNEVAAASRGGRHSGQGGWANNRY